MKAITRALWTLARLRHHVPAWVWRELAVLALFVLASVVMTWPYAKALRTRLPDVGIDDPLLYSRFIFNVHEWMLGHRALGGLFDFDFFYPHLMVATTNDPGLGAALVTFPLRLFTRDYLFIVNFATFASFPLTAHATYLLARRLTGRTWAGIVAGFAYAFCFFRIHQLDHVNVLQTCWLPYALAALLRLRDRPSRASQVLFALALFGAFAGSHNLALYGALVFPPFFVLAIVSAGKGRRLDVAMRLAVPTLVALVMLVPVYGPYLTAKGAWGMVRHRWEIVQYSGRVHQLLGAPASSALYANRAKLLGNESLAFLGWVPLSLAGLAILWPGRATARLRYAFFFVGALYCALSFGPEVNMLDRVVAKGIWEWLYLLPGYESVRTPARFFYVTCLSVSVLAGCGAAQLAVWARRLFVPLGAWPGPLLAAAVLFELRAMPIGMHRVARQVDASPVYTALAKATEPGAVLGLPVHWSREIRPRMLHSIIHGRPTVDGMSAFSLRSFLFMEDERLRTEQGARAFRELHAAGVRYVVLYHRELGVEQRAAYRVMIEKLGARDLGMFGDEQLYELPPPPPSVPLSPEVVRVTLDNGPRHKDSAPRSNATLDVSIEATTDSFVYEHRVRKLRLLVWTGGAKLLEQPIVLAPPLYSPHGSWIERKDVRLALPIGEHFVDWQLRGEKDELFGAGKAKVAVGAVKPL